MTPITTPSHTNILARLSRVARESGTVALWREALPWLCQVCGAQGGSVVLERPPTRFRHGVIPLATGLLIDAWEDTVLTASHWVPSADQSLSTPTPLEPMTTAGIPMLQILLEDGPVIQGGLSLVYGSLAEMNGPLADTASALAGAVGQLAALSAELQSSQRRLTQLNLLQEVGQSIASSLDLADVLRETTNLAASMLDAEGAALLLIDEDQQELIFAVPVGEKEHELRQQRMNINEGVAGWTLRRGQAVIVNDVRNDPRFTKSVDQATGFLTRSILCVPLQANARIVGVLEVVNKRNDQPFTQEDQEWVSALATQAAVAVANAQLFAREQQRVSELTALNQVAATLSQSLDLDKMLEAALTNVLTVVRADAGSIALLDSSGKNLDLRTVYGFDRNLQMLPRKVAVGSGLQGSVAASGEMVVVHDLAADARVGEESKEILARTGLRGAAILPVRSRGRVRGVLSVMVRRTRHFSAEELALLTSISQQIGVAVDNANLYTDLREERDRIIAVHEKVRHELVRDLHDGTAQVLSAMIMNMEVVKRTAASRPELLPRELAYLDDLTRQANREIRQLLFQLRPVILETQGLAAAIAVYAEQLRRHESYALYLELSTGDFKLTSQASGTVFAIVQEALNNIKKHAHASTVWIQVWVARDYLHVTVTDDGTGINMAAINAQYDQHGSFGLLNIRERARLLDAKLEFVSPRPDAGNGTQIQLCVPMDRLLHDKDEG
ncbi:GAF domain-containing sensor histidine kinase [Candidatus Amarolinea dominans]|uniref:GAF domain-containing sensor histidine kinase n=1 Tax=Candidatus Amarolinea dominans TaxID=3140696 RepID=UPI001DA49D9F|nr:GAF domain-containing protein [Anaerolineae bacterium]